MNGYQVTFFTQQDRHHDGKQMHEWLVAAAKDAGVRGSTVVMGAEGTDHTGKRHSFRFFELADQPIEVTMAMTVEQANTLFARLEAEKVNLFYVKAPVEFGTVGASD